MSSDDILRTAQASATDPDPVGTLAPRLGAGPYALICLFVSPAADFGRVVRGMAAAFPRAKIIACTTAGELGPSGYENLHEMAPQATLDRLIQTRVALAEREPGLANAFGFLMIDGLSLKEDFVTATFAPGLGGMPLFGGSAGDGDRFRRTLVAHDGKVMENAAVLALIRTDYDIKVFSVDHLEPSERRMVVTSADPERRVVKAINAEPAAREYARIVGKDPDQLDTFTFAAHPVAVKLGNAHHVRSIQQVTQDGELVFFSAIDEGMVLTVAEPKDMALHLDEALGRLRAGGDPPGAILACDCILRRIEAEQMQRTRDVSDVLARHQVVGFSTYGEQYGPLHVNQTMTGVAFYR